jgi:hypothetical protein
MAQLRINGKDNIFEDDPLEKQLQEFVAARSVLGLTAMDNELQVEACKILGRMEESTVNPSDEVANFLIRLIFSSTAWLAAFRRRAHLPRSEDVADEVWRSLDPTTIDSTIHNYSRLETELADYVTTQRMLGSEPDDADLQRQARVIIYEFDDGWNQTAADNDEWLCAFKQRHLKSPGSNGDSGSGASPSRDGPSFPSPGASSSSAKFRPFKVTPFFLNDTNCYRRLARELGRFVASAMSPKNPNCHIPSDEELQHQARWILFDR